MVSRLWTRFRNSNCKRSHPRKGNKFPRNSFGSLELVVVSIKTVLEQPSSTSSSYPQPARKTWIEGRSTFKCTCTRYGHKRVSGVCWSGWCWILKKNWSAGCRGCFRTGNWYSFFTISVWRLGDGRFSRKPHSARRRERPRELSSNNNNTSLWETNMTPCIADKTSIWNNNRKHSWFCL